MISFLSLHFSLQSGLNSAQQRYSQWLQCTVVLALSKSPGPDDSQILWQVLHMAVQIDQGLVTVTSGLGEVPGTGVVSKVGGSVGGSVSDTSGLGEGSVSDISGLGELPGAGVVSKVVKETIEVYIVEIKLAIILLNYSP